MSNTELKYLAWKDVQRERLNPHIDREMVVGDKIMLARVLMKKGAHVPLHHHHNEQVTYILAGALKFNLHDARYVLERASARETASRVAAGAASVTFTETLANSSNWGSVAVPLNDGVVLFDRFATEDSFKVTVGAFVLIVNATCVLSPGGLPSELSCVA